MVEHHQSNLLKGLERLAQKCGPVVRSGSFGAETQKYGKTRKAHPIADSTPRKNNLAPKNDGWKTRFFLKRSFLRAM